MYELKFCMKRMEQFMGYKDIINNQFPSDESQLIPINDFMEPKLLTFQLRFSK